MSIKYLYVLVFAITSCSVIEERGNFHVEIDNEDFVVVADSIFESVNYIPLETTDENLIASVGKVVIENNTIYIFDDKQYDITQYGINGSYLRSLSKRGRGPGEYLSIIDFALYDSILVVLSSQNRKLFFYTKNNFQFLKTITFPISSVRLKSYDNKLYIYCGNMSQDYFNMYVLDPFSVRVINRYNEFDKKSANFFYSRRIFNISSDYNYYFEPYNYHIYEATPDGDSVVFLLDFGKKNMYDSEFLSMSPKAQRTYLKDKFPNRINRPISGIDNLYYSDSLIFFTFVRGVVPYWYIQKKGITPCIGSVVASEYFPLLNSNVVYIDEEYIYEMVYPETILEKVEYCKENGKEHLIAQIPDWLISGIKFDDNPVLCRYKLKK